MMLSSAALAEPEHDITGKATLTASYNDAINTARMSRLEGDDSFDLSANLQLSYDYSNDNWGVFSHVQLTSEGKSKRGNVGIVELYGYYDWFIDQNNSVTFTLGQLFMPSSMENSEEFWDSPFSNNFSVLNSWIAQEVRPIGFEAKYDWLADESSPFSAFGIGTMTFVSNDSMASQLAWRGWSSGRHKSVYNEVLDLPAIYHIQNGAFADQRDDGSKPFGRDLDHQLGYLVHGYWSPNTDFTFKYSYLDNGGTGELLRGEYAWTTYFSILGGQWQINNHWRLLGESMTGRSSMGDTGAIGVAIEFETQYLLLSYNHLQWDYSIRLERFENVDVANNPTESHDKGKAITLSSRWQGFGEPWSVITELLLINSDDRRTRLLDIGHFNDKNESQLSISLNYFF
jgi:hypothetical protein